MNPRTKIFIAEYDCASLVSLMLWLEQFPEFEVAGASNNGAQLVDRIGELHPDVVLLDVNKGAAENLPVLRAIKAFASAPAVLLRSPIDSNDNMLQIEADGSVVPSTSIKELCEAIRKAANKRRVAMSAANMPLTKAG